MTTTKPKVLVSAPVPADLSAALANACEVWSVPPAEVAATLQREGERLAAIDGILTTIRLKIDDALLQRCPRLRVVSNFAVGYDNVDVPAATRRRVLICNTPGVLDGAVADLTFALLIGIARQVAANDVFVRSGQWKAGPAPLTRDIRGKTLGLLGLGRIGRLVAKTARGFDLKVIYHKPTRDKAAEAEGLAEYRERDALFAESDFLSVHCPLSPETTRSIGAREFALMKSSAYFINTARGMIVDETALIAALQAGTIAGAGLDVMAVEPIDKSHPLCALPNVLLQPHIGSATVETRRAMMELAVENLLAALSGKPPRAVVNRELVA
jgi:lactate dehydrogenase-like 2-hydroxyacid dehydrogenase